MDNFPSVTGTLYVTGNSQKEKGKALKKHILKELYHMDLALELQRFKKSTKVQLKTSK